MGDGEADAEAKVKDALERERDLKGAQRFLPTNFGGTCLFSHPDLVTGASRSAAGGATAGAACTASLSLRPRLNLRLSFRISIVLAESYTMQPPGSAVSAHLAPSPPQNQARQLTNTSRLTGSVGQSWRAATA